MGLTIESKNCSIDLGYGGFKALRTKVAELTAPDIYEHYKNLETGMILFGTVRQSFFDNYNAKIQQLSEKYHGEKDEILDFLYASDCSGEMDLEHCKSIYEIIKDYDDDICYGYCGRSDCAMFKDFKMVLEDCINNNCNMEWF